MLAAPVDRLPTGPGWCYEPKWDGWRGLAFRQGNDRVQLQSRSGKPLAGYFPEVTRLVRGQVPAGAVLDGELIIWDPVRERTSFASLQRRITAGARVLRLARETPAQYVVFDVLATADGVLTDRPLLERRAVLEALLDGAPPALVLCPQTSDADEAWEWVAAWARAGVEGLVAKRLDGRYETGRRTWRKLRTKTITEAIVGGVTGTLSQPETLLLGRFDSSAGRLRYVGRTHALSLVQRRELAYLLTTAPQRRAGGVDHPWPQPLPASWSGQFQHPEPLSYIQVEPAIVVEINADTAFEHRRWRHRVHLHRARVDMSIYDVPLLTGEL